MARSAIYRRSGGIEFNMTPLIDVTFQLIMFFILTGQIASTALAKLELPEPYRSQALKEEEQERHKVIVNVLSKGTVGEDVDPFLAGEVAYYYAKDRKFDVGQEAELVQLLEEERDRVPESKRAGFFVEVRADRRVYFEGVEPVLAAAADAGVEKMNITAIRDLGS